MSLVRVFWIFTINMILYLGEKNDKFFLVGTDPKRTNVRGPLTSVSSG